MVQRANMHNYYRKPLVHEGTIIGKLFGLWAVSEQDYNLVEVHLVDGDLYFYTNKDSRANPCKARDTKQWLRLLFEDYTGMHKMIGVEAVPSNGMSVEVFCDYVYSLIVAGSI